MRSIEPILKEFIVNSRVAFWRNLLPPLLLPERARANRLARELMDICGALVRRAREQRERGELPQDCMLQSLLTLEDLQTGKPLSDEEIFSEFHMYLIAVRAFLFLSFRRLLNPPETPLRRESCAGCE